MVAQIDSRIRLVLAHVCVCVCVCVCVVCVCVNHSVYMTSVVPDKDNGLENQPSSETSPQKTELI
jgi:hypothetical protein